MARDFLQDVIEHSWGKKPEQKAAEKRYNAEYYRRNKEKWKKYQQAAKARQSQYDKNVEGAQIRYDDAAKKYASAKQAYDTLSSQYQKFLKGANDVGKNDKEIAKKRQDYQSQLEKLADDLDKAEKAHDSAKANLDTQKKKRDQDRSTYESTMSENPFSKRQQRSANAAAANEAAKAERFKTRGTKSARTKTRANSMAISEAAKAEATKQKSEAFIEKQKKRREKVNDELTAAKQARGMINDTINENLAKAKALQKIGQNPTGVDKIMETVKNDMKKLTSLDKRIKEFEEEKKLLDKY